MQRADQFKVTQLANLELVKIRNHELLYFQHFFTSMGIQAAVMVGTMTGSISQCPAWAERTVHQPFSSRFLYFTSTAATLATGMLCFLSCVFIAVYGQSLALRGPAGSMVRAVNAMIAEQKQVLSSFLLMLVFFVFTEIGMFWVIMDDYLATIGTLGVLLGCCVTYHYCLRIYNRFYFAGLKGIGWKTDYVDDRLRESIGESRESIGDPAGNFVERRSVSIGSKKTIVKDLQKLSKTTSKTLSSVKLFKFFRKGKSSGNDSVQVGESGIVANSTCLSVSPISKSITTPTIQRSDSNHSTNVSTETARYISSTNSNRLTADAIRARAPVVANTGDDKSVVSDGSGSVFRDDQGHAVAAPSWLAEYDPSSMILEDSDSDSASSKGAKGGYLTTKTDSRPSRMSTFGIGKNRTTWQRMYFVIKITDKISVGGSSALVYYYKDKAAFKAAPRKPINRRGIDLEGYQITVTRYSDLSIDDEAASVMSSSTARTRAPVYEFCLVPENSVDVRKVWDFRCDTEMEMKKWIFLFAAAIESSNQYTSDAYNSEATND